jgi:HTH-type transcriptional regulator/antitoxin MqsA
LGYAKRKEEQELKCDLCEGEYEEKVVVRSYRWHGKTIVVEDVPALVCDRCGDTLIKEETVATIDELLRREVEPLQYAPVYRFPTKVA